MNGKSRSGASEGKVVDTTKLYETLQVSWNRFTGISVELSFERRTSTHGRRIVSVAIVDRAGVPVSMDILFLWE
jgi:hypothetical protein